MPPADIVVDADVASCPKNSNSVVRARLVTVRGRPCGDLRIFVGPESQTATRMGICIARRLLPELRRDAPCQVPPRPTRDTRRCDYSGRWGSGISPVWRCIPPSRAPDREAVGIRPSPSPSGPALPATEE